MIEIGRGLNFAAADEPWWRKLSPPLVKPDGQVPCIRLPR